MKAIYWKQDALKLVQCVCKCFLLWTDLKMLGPKHSSFLCRLCLRSSAAQNFRRHPPASVSSPNSLRFHAAQLGGVLRQRRSCRALAEQRSRGGRQGRRWPGASKAGPEKNISNSVVISRQRRFRPTPWGRTPLHRAVAGFELKAAELLLSKGAAVDAKGDDGPGPHSGKQGLKSRLTAEGFPGLRFWERICIFSKCLGRERCDFTRQNVRNAEFCVGINDHNATCLKHVENGWSVDFQEMPQGIYSSLVERATERQKVNLVSSFDFGIQEVPFREWQETQVQSQAEKISVDCYAPYARPPHSRLILGEWVALSRGKTPLDLAREKGRTEMEQLLLNPPAWAPRAMVLVVFIALRGGAGWN